MNPRGKPRLPFNLKIFLATAKGERTNAEYRTNERICVQCALDLLGRRTGRIVRDSLAHTLPPALGDANLA